MVRCRWTEEKERALIAFYAGHSCLWDKRSEDRNKRQLRLQLLEALSRRLSDHAASVSVHDIKCKFKNLRTVFNREHKSVQASRTSGKLHPSKWKHYQQLLFLCEPCDDGEPLEEGRALEPQDKRASEPGALATSSRARGSSSSHTQPDGFSESSTPSDEARTRRGAARRISPDEGTPSWPGPLQLSASASGPAHAGPPQRSDLRPSVDSRSHWSDTKVQQLISFYSGHRCLWNHRSESHRNRLLKQSLLELLSSLLSEGEPVPFTVEDIKTKFRNLRTIFQREHKAVTSNKTCGSEDFYLPKWKHYRELMFLCDSCDEEEEKDEKEKEEKEEEEKEEEEEEEKEEEESQESCLQLLGPQTPPFSLLYHGDLQSANELDVPPQSLGTPPSPTPPDSRCSSPPSSPSVSPSHPDSRGRKRAGRDLLPSGGELLNFMRTLCQGQTPSAHAGFLKYVEECLNETPPDKVRKLKKKIIEMIHSVSEEV